MANTGVTKSEEEIDREAMELIKSSGVLNPNMTLDKIMDLTQKLNQLSAGVATAAHTDTFIHKHFIYKHTD